MLSSLPESLLEFLNRALPSPQQWLLYFAPALLYALLAAVLAGRLRVHYGWRVGYTRKVFHFLIFTAAGVLQLLLGLPAVVILGTATSLLVLFAVYRGEQLALYQALARPTDHPREKFFILVPLITTAVGGVLANLLFPAYAAIGYLVGGWGDAVGEPVGSRWGRHRYRVPSLVGVNASRSLEGSSAVFAVSALVATLALGLGYTSWPLALGVGLAVALISSLVEAVSTHGLDNLTMQLAAAGTAQVLFSFFL